MNDKYIPTGAGMSETDVEQAMTRFRAGFARVASDPGEAARIRALADQADRDLANDARRAGGVQPQGTDSARSPEDTVRPQGARSAPLPWNSGDTSRGSAGTLTAFLLDGHEVVRRGVRDMLEAEGDIKVIGEAGTAASALARIPVLRPDVAVMEVRLPDGDGVAVCREIRSKMPDVGCLMLTPFADDEALMDAVMGGAAGYVLKQIRGTDLVDAVRTVASGQSMLDPGAASQLMARLRGGPAKHDPQDGLTPQERRILELIGQGLTNRQIGEKMFLAETTVKNYISALFAKLGMERRTQAAAYAAKVFNTRPNRRP